MINLSDILTDKDFHLKMRFAKRELAEFFGKTPANEDILAARQQWIAQDPETHVAIMPEGVDLLDEAIQFADAIKALPPAIGIDAFSALEPFERCRKLGEIWEPDFLLMKADDQGVFRLVGGSLCFPSHWDLREKLSRTMHEIHAPVPGLNEILGKQINGFLQLIKPGISWERENWGLSRTPELNLHPARSLPRLDEHVALDDVWFRLERQSLMALPQSGGILFGIRLDVIPLVEIHANPEWRRGMARALRSMPDEMARYKGILPTRSSLLKAFEQH